MIDSQLAAMLVVIAVGTYFQTVTGFGLAMIVLGAANGFKLMPLDMAAILISLIALLNCAVALPRNFRHIDWRATWTIMLGTTPATLVGIWLLDYLAVSATEFLRFLLGVTITVSGIFFALRPARRPTRSPDAGFVGIGGIAGLIGGMFGFQGPPLIYHLYRQPIDVAAVRSTLIMLFACGAAVRTTIVGIQGGLGSQTIVVFGWSIGIVVLATMLGQHYPPRLGTTTMRRITFAVLACIGISLMLAAIANSWG